MTLKVLPLTPDRIADLDAIFHARGCSVAKHCYCMYYRRSGRPADSDPNQSPSCRNRAALLALASGDLPPGLVAYHHGQPVGWVSLGPRADFARLRKSRTMRAVDDQEVWSVICFVVPSEFRRQGIAHQLLAEAISFARQHQVKILEAYPVDRAAGPAAPQASWFGSLSMFRKTGFEEVARHTPARPIVRLQLTRFQKNVRRHPTDR
jgi:GNAT superfamily N-acetyltransferase